MAGTLQGAVLRTSPGSSRESILVLSSDVGVAICVQELLRAPLTSEKLTEGNHIDDLIIFVRLFISMLGDLGPGLTSVIMGLVA